MYGLLICLEHLTWKIFAITFPHIFAQEVVGKYLDSLDLVSLELTSKTMRRLLTDWEEQTPQLAWREIHQRDYEGLSLLVDSSWKDSFVSFSDLRTLLSISSDDLVVLNQETIRGLKIANWYYNQLSSLPDSIGQLTSLSQLWCSYNQLSSLPDSIGQLISLSRFDCSNNELSSLPDSIGQLKSLSLFNCRNNRLRALPDSIGQLKSLSVFSCDNNQSIEFIA